MSLSKVNILSLYRSMLRSAGKMSDYNFRDHARRRVTGGFRSHQAVTGDEQTSAFRYGQEQLALLQRQSSISQMFPEEANVSDRQLT
jgi:LYR motif-containing protein 4